MWRRGKRKASADERLDKVEREVERLKVRMGPLSCPHVWRLAANNVFLQVKDKDGNKLEEDRAILWCVKCGHFQAVAMSAAGLKWAQSGETEQGPAMGM